MHDAGELVGADAASSKVSLCRQRVHHGNKRLCAELLTTCDSPDEVKVNRIGEEALLAYEEGIVKPAHIIAFDFRLHAVFFHGFAEILQHGEGIFKHVIDKYLPRFAVNDAEVHRVGIQRCHFGFDCQDLG